VSFLASAGTRRPKVTARQHRFARFLRFRTSWLLARGQNQWFIRSHCLHIAVGACARLITVHADPSRDRRAAEPATDPPKDKCEQVDPSSVSVAPPSPQGGATETSW